VGGAKLLWMTGLVRGTAPCETAAACATSSLANPLRQREEFFMSAATAAALKEKPDPSTRFAKDQLKAIIERIEHLEEEKKAIADDIRDVYAEAKGNGYDVKALRTVVRLRKQDKNERAEQEAILETYLHALGMI
jgi:uncharacterized protein (UPF0335 family)